MRFAALLTAVTLFVSGSAFYVVKANATGAGGGGVFWLIAVVALVLLVAVFAADSERRSRL